MINRLSSELLVTQHVGLMMKPLRYSGLCTKIILHQLITVEIFWRLDNISEILWSQNQDLWWLYLVAQGRGLELGRGTNMGHVVLEYSRMDYSGCQSIEFAGLAVMAFDG